MTQTNKRRNKTKRRQRNKNRQFGGNDNVVKLRTLTIKCLKIILIHHDWGYKLAHREPPDVIAAHEAYKSKLDGLPPAELISLLNKIYRTDGICYQQFSNELLNDAFLEMIDGEILRILSDTRNKDEVQKMKTIIGENSAADVRKKNGTMLNSLIQIVLSMISDKYQEQTFFHGLLSSEYVLEDCKEELHEHIKKTICSIYLDFLTIFL